jgi:hypothetical protein
MLSSVYSARSIFIIILVNIFVIIFFSIDIYQVMNNVHSINGIVLYEDMYYKYEDSDKKILALSLKNSKKDYVIQNDIFSELEMKSIYNTVQYGEKIQILFWGHVFQGKSYKVIGITYNNVKYYNSNNVNKYKKDTKAIDLFAMLSIIILVTFAPILISLQNYQFNNSGINPYFAFFIPPFLFFLLCFLFFYPNVLLANERKFFFISDIVFVILTCIYFIILQKKIKTNKKYAVTKKNIVLLILTIILTSFGIISGGNSFINYILRSNKIEIIEGNITRKNIKNSKSGNSYYLSIIDKKQRKIIFQVNAKYYKKVYLNQYTKFSVKKGFNFGYYLN